MKLFEVATAFTSEGAVSLNEVYIPTGEQYKDVADFKRHVRADGNINKYKDKSWILIGRTTSPVIAIKPVEQYVIALETNKAGEEEGE